MLHGQQNKKKKLHKICFILYYKLHVSAAFDIIIRVAFNSTKNTKKHIRN